MMAKPGERIEPGAMIGIIGGGQLGRMLAMAASRMGYRPHIYTPEQHSPASQVTNHVTVGDYSDAEKLATFARSCDIVTYEFENIPESALERLQESCLVYPNPAILKICRHRLREKDFITKQGLKTAPYRAVRSMADLEAAAAETGYPCVLKTCELGYDGKGQVKIENVEGLATAWERLQTEEAILEGWLNFQAEISVVVACDNRGRVSCYEPSHNLHKNHVLSQCKVPANMPSEVLVEAKKQALKLAGAFKLIGLVAVEMFVMPKGEILINEIAPRPHNSGHWTIEGAATSQFEQLIRAITGQRLGGVNTLCPTEMLNLIGDDVHHLKPYQDNPQAHIHLYGKAEAREGRKMGHVTILSPQ